eukprot:746000-Pyramimonas_sp.AAC.1
MPNAERLRTLLKNVPMSWAMTAQKTYLGGGITNQRMQRQSMCMYGCHQRPDAVWQYVVDCAR